jgi:hypothetical protein
MLLLLLLLAAARCNVQGGKIATSRTRKAVAGGQNCKHGAATLTDIAAASVVVAGCC